MWSSQIDAACDKFNNVIFIIVSMTKLLANEEYLLNPIANIELNSEILNIFPLRLGTMDYC